jgi:hypothetical protein
MVHLQQQVLIQQRLIYTTTAAVGVQIALVIAVIIAWGVISRVLYLLHDTQPLLDVFLPLSPRCLGSDAQSAIIG